MKRIGLFLIFGILIQSLMYAKENLNNDIYRELCLFLVNQNVISEEQMSGFKEDYSSLIALSDIFEEYHPQNNTDLSKEFGIYKFGFLHIEGHAPYILIRTNDSCKIFIREQTDVIIQEILRVRDVSPKLIDEVLFSKYLREITNYNIGIIIMERISNVDFFINLPISQ